MSRVRYTTTGSSRYSLRIGSFFAAIVFAITVGGGWVQASEASDSGNYCGIYSLFAAAKYEGVELPFETILRPEYVSTPAGSTLDNLEQAAHAMGLQAAGITNLTTRSLGAAPCPMVLHVKHSNDTKAYDHWIVFLGIEGHYVWLYDPPNPPALATFAQLAQEWDGVALAVSPKTISLIDLQLAEWQGILFWVLFLVCGSFVLKGIRSRMPATRPATVWSMSLVIIKNLGYMVIAATLAGLFYNFVNDEGFLNGQQAVGAIQGAFATSFIPRLDVSEVKRLSSVPNSAVLVDARYSADFAQGHLSDAISIPVNIDDEGFRKASSTLPKDRQIIVYCESISCEFADKIARRFISLGYDHVALFPGGWEEWSQASKVQRDGAIQ